MFSWLFVIYNVLLILFAEIFYVCLPLRLKEAPIYRLSSVGLRNCYIRMVNSVSLYLSVFPHVSLLLGRKFPKKKRYGWMWTLALEQKFYARLQAIFWRFVIVKSSKILHINQVTWFLYFFPKFPGAKASGR